MEKTLTLAEIRDKLAAHYRGIFDRWFFLMEEAKAAHLDGDEDTFKAISRRADKLSDNMDGIKNAAGVLGIDLADFLGAVNADR